MALRLRSVQTPARPDGHPEQSRGVSQLLARTRIIDYQFIILKNLIPFILNHSFVEIG
jgi:hypothetical protein